MVLGNTNHCGLAVGTDNWVPSRRCWVENDLGTIFIKGETCFHKLHGKTPGKANTCGRKSTRAAAAIGRAERRCPGLAGPGVECGGRGRSWAVGWAWGGVG